MKSLKPYIAELIGTFALVFAGTGAIIVNDVSGGAVTHVGVALTFGLIVMTMIYSVGNVSGAHFNPAVTVAFWVAGRFELKKVPPYIFSQLSGAFLASALLWIMFSGHQTLGATLPVGSWQQSFVFEVVLTFLLMFVILNVSTGAMEKGLMAGVAIGGTVALEAMFAGPISGASMNPARSIAPAIFSGQYQTLWIYITAPILGALLAVPACFCTQDDCC